MALNNQISEVLEAPCFGFISATENKESRITRVFGFKYDDLTKALIVYTFEKDTKKVLDFLEKGTKIASVISDASNFKTIQFKGSFLRSYLVDNEEIEIVKTCNAGQGEIMSMFGIPDEVFQSWAYSPTLALVMVVDEIFDQTPKPNTGNKIS